ncbi:coproporphyrinogen-III oxidase, putative [Hepatocystis sp. ex Piliocolobus tephrosceles]|nr:coproporphyrinogen-III oxidase, putative [Hepatocystis sp. ex Piliocolobus tephrosceles]
MKDETEQKNVCDMFESMDTVKFKEEKWNKTTDKHKEAGGGITRVLENGVVFEKCAVNYSCVYGKITKEAAREMCVNQYNKEYMHAANICHSNDINSCIAKIMENNNMKHIGEKYKYYACGLSIIAHPVNPNVPTTHMNFRFFQVFIKTKKKEKKKNGHVNNYNSNKLFDNLINANRKDNGVNKSSSNTNISVVSSGNINNKNNNIKKKIGDNYKCIKYWFGGGYDLSPCYIFPELFIKYHESLKTACDKYNHLFYPCFKIWCDLYFRIKHRNMNRGIGGIFFDNLLDNNIKKSKSSKHSNLKNKINHSKIVNNNQNVNRNVNTTTTSSNTTKYFGDINNRNVLDNNKSDCTCYSCNAIMDHSYKMIYLFIQECIMTFRKSYYYIISQTINEKYDEKMVHWQRVCRGRYAEFNLIYDRGTKFGLSLMSYNTYSKKKKKNDEDQLHYAPINSINDEEYEGQTLEVRPDEHERIDNVLSSLPLKCEFFYKYKIEEYSREYEMMQIFKYPKKWVNY